MGTQDVFDIINIIKKQDSEKSRTIWMETISNRGLAIQVLQLLGPLGRKKLAEDIRS